MSYSKEIMIRTVSENNNDVLSVPINNNEIELWNIYSSAGLAIFSKLRQNLPGGWFKRKVAAASHAAHKPACLPVCISVLCLSVFGLPVCLLGSELKLRQPEGAGMR